MTECFKGQSEVIPIRWHKLESENKKYRQFSFLEAKLSTKCIEKWWGIDEAWNVEVTN